MKAAIWAVVGSAVLAQVTGCALDTGESGEEDVSSVQLGLALCPTGAACVTKSLGNLTVRYYTCGWSSLGQRNKATCTVDSDFVLVGGGAEIADDGAPGALLTGSYPSGESWIARSKDHEQAYPHRTRAYAIGLRIAGLSKSALQQSVKTKSFSSTGTVAHPSISYFPPSNELILSGGAWTTYTGAGQLLTKSNRSSGGTGWVAASKDHVTSDPGGVDVYVTTILKRPIGTTIDLATDQATSESLSSGGGYRSTTSISVDSSFVTGIGASDSGANRLLTDAYPSSSARGGGTVTTKDHMTPASGAAQLTLVRLREL
ncbi:MAG: hypothetical protein EOO73_34890 [Myxococcales bacterium]|nr:MAG: hypothetical protein EOO73_34890 [Myxococcales bacterium]